VVTIKAQEAGRAFIEMVNTHPDLTVDDLLVIHFLTRHREINAAQAAEICQRPPEAARELLARLANHARLIESGGPTGRGRYFRLTSSAYAALGTEPDYDRDARLSQENLKARVLTTLQRRSLSNADIRQITQLDRNQAKRLMEALRQENLVHTTGAGRGARWALTAQPQMGDAPK
jgi:ATP-dependent DNA helicase RecG